MLKKSVYLPIALSAILAINSAYASNDTSNQPLTPGSLFQVSTVSALAAGVFDGHYPYSALMAMSTPETIGIGTFQDLDNEMVAIDGKYYQMTDTGHLNPVKSSDIAPFAEIANMGEKTTISPLNNLPTFTALSDAIQKKFSNENRPYAIRIDGEFNVVNMRSFRKQTPPFPTLAQATKTQAEFKLKSVKGSLVGFWFPPYLGSIGLSGFHFHFITSDKKMGGHVLEVNVKTATLQLTPIQQVSFSLPTDQEFSNLNLNNENLEKIIQTAENMHGK